MRGTLQALTTGSLDETCWNETTLGILTFYWPEKFLRSFLYIYINKNDIKMIWIVLILSLVLLGLLIYYVLEKQYVNGSNSVENIIREGIIENIKPGVIMYRLDKPENPFVEAKYRYIKILDVREWWVKFCHESLFQDDEKMTFNEDFPCYYEIETLIDLYKIYYGKEQQ